VEKIAYTREYGSDEMKNKGRKREFLKK